MIIGYYHSILTMLRLSLVQFINCPQEYKTRQVIDTIYHVLPGQCCIHVQIYPFYHPLLLDIYTDIHDLYDYEIYSIWADIYIFVPYKFNKHLYHIKMILRT